MNKKKFFSILLASFAMSFILVGFFKNGFISVLQKAVFICLECIGIG
ncbi:MAG: CD1871A family CXXC motif-containing protein [Treponemataceae bacterium]